MSDETSYDKLLKAFTDEREERRKILERHDKEREDTHETQRRLNEEYAKALRVLQEREEILIIACKQIDIKDLEIQALRIRLARYEPNKE